MYMGEIRAIQDALIEGGYKATHSEVLDNPWLGRHELDQEPAAFVFYVDGVNEEGDGYQWIKETMRKEGYQLFLTPRMTYDGAVWTVNVAFVKTYLLHQLEMDVMSLVKELTETRFYLLQDSDTVQGVERLTQQHNKWLTFLSESQLPHTRIDAKAYFSHIHLMHETLAYDMTYRKHDGTVSDRITELIRLLWHLGAAKERADNDDDF